MAVTEFEDVVVLIPGIMGSVLERDGKVIWGGSTDTILRALFSGTSSLADDLDLANQSGEVVATRLLTTVHMLPALWKIDGYDTLSQMLVDKLKLLRGENFFEFPYDWRLDNRVNAKLLQEQSSIWLENWRSSRGGKHAKLILVAHSMGGLISRYFIEHERGWRDTRALYTLGTPFRGSLNAVDALSNGLRVGPLAFTKLTHVLRNFPSAYQLLPRYRCFDQGDGNMIRLDEAQEIPNLALDQVKQGIGFQHEIARSIERNQQSNSYYENRPKIHPIVGIAQATFQAARLGDATLQMLYELNGENLGGDGTVPRVSAIPFEEERDGRQMYVGTKHAALQSALPVQTHLFGKLTHFFEGEQYNSLRSFGAAHCIALSCADVYFADQPVLIKARPGISVAQMQVRIVQDATGELVGNYPLKLQADGSYQGSYTLPAGYFYRIQVSAQGAINAAEDSFYVA